MNNLLRQAGMRPLHSSIMDQCDVIVFNGGADIGTEIYGELPCYSGIPRSASPRDRSEMEQFSRFEGKDKLLVGICRGAQLLNCLNGGTLWQDVNHHGRDHTMTLVEDGRVIAITSTHHQMMRPNYNTGRVIATADQSTRKSSEKDIYLGQDNFPDARKDTEIVWYPNTRSLCIQGHPEYVPGSVFAEYCLGLMLACLQEIRNVA